MASLAYMTKRGAGIVKLGTCAELGKAMMRLRTPATLRSNHGAIVGTMRKCDGTCDNPCPGKGWHGFYDPTGDETVTAESYPDE
jgi:hypothetical protein